MNFQDLFCLEYLSTVLADSNVIDLRLSILKRKGFYLSVFPRIEKVNEIRRVKQRRFSLRNLIVLKSETVCLYACFFVC